MRTFLPYIWQDFRLTYRSVGSLVGQMKARATNDVDKKCELAIAEGTADFNLPASVLDGDVADPGREWKAVEWLWVGRLNVYEIFAKNRISFQKHERSGKVEGLGLPDQHPLVKSSEGGGIPRTKFGVVHEGREKRESKVHR